MQLAKRNFAWRKNNSIYPHVLKPDFDTECKINRNKLNSMRAEIFDCCKRFKCLLIALCQYFKLLVYIFVDGYKTNLETGFKVNGVARVGQSTRLAILAT